MSNKNINLIANKLVKAFLNNKTISPIPIRYTKKIAQAQKLRKLSESKIMYLLIFTVHARELSKNNRDSKVIYLLIFTVHAREL